MGLPSNTRDVTIRSPRCMHGYRISSDSRFTNGRCLIGIYVFKGPYCTLTTTNWFFQELSVIPRGSWRDVARRFTLIRWANPKLSRPPPFHNLTHAVGRRPPPPIAAARRPAIGLVPISFSRPRRRRLTRLSAERWPTVGRRFAHGGAICRWVLHAGGARWLLVLRNRCAKTRRDARRAPRISRPSARPCAACDLEAAAAAVRPLSGDVSGDIATTDFF
ncbi:hypothetical protein F511_29443 [Dorcoceras hygrometricum]|uniref:Uncharacterized protein n=1 Tax=Dorcoceras hygrometricum TaxID=472368 RepID=A0A2Z7D1Y1_9LAMI|nr:hypothetical protein F511_29443 [Dorcoceras hygrometricum]